MPLWFKFVTSDCQHDLHLGLSLGTNHGVSWVVRHVSRLVVRRCGAQRWWSMARWRSNRDVPCWWTWSGEGQTWSLDQATRRSGDQPQWLTSGDIGKCKCTWEWPCWPSQDGGRASRVEALEDLATGSSKTAVTCVKWRGTCMEYATRGGCWYFLMFIERIRKRMELPL
jgi:hypothetical protein